MSQMSMPQSSSVLLEALPYIRRFSGTTIVIKFGGAVMENANLCRDFARDIVLLQHVGIKPVIVHGGGPQIDSMFKELSIPTEFIDGHRVTSETSVSIAEMVLAGKINKEIVALINQEGGCAVGVSGRDGKLATASLYSIEKINADGCKEDISLGRVGKVRPANIQPTLLRCLERNGYVPVIAPIAADSEGRALNINADTMSGAIAVALEAKKLILLTDVPGVIVDEKRITQLGPEDIRLLKEKKQISGGMIPKIDCCMEAVNGGVEQAHIINGKTSHAVLLEIFTDKGIGTMITKNLQEIKNE